MSYMERDVDKSAVYYNIFLRKLDRNNYDLSDLKQMLQNGSFCDPSHKDTGKLGKNYKFETQQLISHSFFVVKKNCILV